MALKLAHTFKNIACEYWKIVHVQHCYDRNKTIARLALYLDADARTAGVANHLESKQFAFDGDEYTRAELYALIKAPVYVPDQNDPENQIQTNEFHDAEDC
jgi:hypothetical protein